MCWLAVDAPQVALEVVPVTRRVLCAQLDADAQDTAMGVPILLLAAFKLTPVLSCSIPSQYWTHHHNILWYTLVIIVLHIHTRAGTCSSCNDPVAFKLTMVIPDTVGVISDVTFNKVVGYYVWWCWRRRRRRNFIDDSYNLWHHQMFIEMY